MPFNPDEVAKGLGLETQIPQAKPAFDPDQAAATLGLQSANQVVQAQPSKSEAFLRGASQGATLGFQDEATAAVDAAAEKMREMVGGSSSLAPDKGFDEKYQAALDQRRAENQAAQQAHPGYFLGGKITGTLPAAISTGGNTLGGQVAASGGLSALNSLGESEGKSASDAAIQAGKAGAWGAGLAGILGLGMKVAGSALSSLFKNPSQALKTSYDLEKSLTDPEVTNSVQQSIDATEQKFADLTRQSRDTIGQGLKQFAESTNATVDPNSVIKNTVNALADYNPGRNATAAAMKSDLQERLSQLSFDLFKNADEDGKIPFAVLHEAKQQLGQEVFDQGVYSSDRYTDKVAKQLYNGISSLLKSADETGQYGELNKVYKALSSTDPDAFTANTLKYFNDPFDRAARDRLGKLLGDLRDMSPDVRSHIPELSNFIDQDLTNAAAKIEMLKNIGGKNGIFVLKGIPLPSPSGQAANLGAAIGQSPLKPAFNAVQGVAEGLRALTPVQGPIAAPVAGGLQTIGASQLGQRFSQ